MLAEPAASRHGTWSLQGENDRAAPSPRPSPRRGEGDRLIPPPRSAAQRRVYRTLRPDGEKVPEGRMRGPIFSFGVVLHSFSDPQ